MALPIVAVVGRPNVGKSTLVNRITQKRDAIVFETSGVTRDRSYHKADWNGVDFMLVDTGGLEMATADRFGTSIREQALTGVHESDAVIFLVDGATGPQSDDEAVARILQKSDKPVFLAVNKMDNPARDEAIHEFWSLGLGEPWPVSALHGHGSGDMLDALVDALPREEAPEEEAAVQVAIIGRPNAGKSSLLNRLAGVERAIVSDVAGTTRDSIDTLVQQGDRVYRLIDTAGLRRKAAIDESVEYYSFVRAMRAIDRAEVALLVVDSEVGVTDQDQRVASFAEERGCALVVLLNKWDTLSEEEDRERVESAVARNLGFVGYAPVLRISAKTGRGLDRIWDAVDTVHANWEQKVPTSALNKLLAELRETGHTISKRNKTLRIQYATQTRTGPPGITFFANHPEIVDENYERYLENRLRERFDFEGTPMTLAFRRKDRDAG